MILNKVRRHVRENGPCIIPNYGAAYTNGKTVDPIGMLSGSSRNELRRYYKVISDISCRRLVVTIGNRFKVNLDDSRRRAKFVALLQGIQDAHDFNFDPFYKLCSMEGFLSDLHNLEIDTNLHFG